MAEQRADGMSLLKGLKRNLPERGRVASTEEAERRILAMTDPLTELTPEVGLGVTRAVAQAGSLETAREITRDVRDDTSPEVLLEYSIDTTADRRLDVTHHTALLRKKKKYTTTFTLRMDLDLYRRLKDVADFNELQMTSMINEAISLHLAAFEQPPPNWKRRR